MWKRKIFGQQGRNERKKYLYGIIWTVEKKKNGKRKGQKYLGNRNIWSEEEKKSAEGKKEKESCCETETGGRHGTDIEGSIRGPRRPKKVKKNLPLNPPS